MYILNKHHIILVIITMFSEGGHNTMYKLAAAVLCLMSLAVLCSCVRTGERDSLDFLSSMAERGFECRVDETFSTDRLKESCYVDGCKLSLYSNSQGKLTGISVTYEAENPHGFNELACAAAESFCGFSADEIQSVFEVLGIDIALPEDSEGVKRCDTQWYGFSFTSDRVGGALVIRSYRLEPTSAPEVTLNTTVPFVTSASSEKSSS